MDICPENCHCRNCDPQKYHKESNWDYSNWFPNEEQFKAMNPELYNKRKPGPVPSFPKYKLFTFTVTDEHIIPADLADRVKLTLSKDYVPMWYIAAIEFGERTSRIHCHVLASFGPHCFKDSKLTYQKFNSRFKERYARTFKLGHIDVKPVDLKSNPRSVFDICNYFDPDYVFFSNDEAKNIYSDMLKEAHALPPSRSLPPPSHSPLSASHTR